MDTITINGLTFSVNTETDFDAGAPWDREDGHGPVREVRTDSKRPGERILHSGRHYDHAYDFAEAMRIAKRDGWGLAPEAMADLTANLGREPTAGEVTAAAVEFDYRRLRDWCHDRWGYVGVVVTLQDTDGDDTRESESLWGIESDAHDYLEEIAQELAETLANRIGGDTHITRGAKRWQVRA